MSSQPSIASEIEAWLSVREELEPAKEPDTISSLLEDGLSRLWDAHEAADKAFHSWGSEG